MQSRPEKSGDRCKVVVRGLLITPEWLIVCLLLRIRTLQSYDILKNNNYVPLPDHSKKKKFQTSWIVGTCAVAPLAPPSGRPCLHVASLYWLSSFQIFNIFIVKNSQLCTDSIKIWNYSLLSNEKFGILTFVIL